MAKHELTGCREVFQDISGLTEATLVVWPVRAVRAVDWPMATLSVASAARLAGALLLAIQALQGGRP
jgi:hypothetical protein